MAKKVDLARLWARPGARRAWSGIFFPWVNFFCRYGQLILMVQASKLSFWGGLCSGRNTFSRAAGARRANFNFFFQILKFAHKCYLTRYYTPACGRPSPNGTVSLNLLLYRLPSLQFFILQGILILYFDFFDKQSKWTEPSRFKNYVFLNHLSLHKIEKPLYFILKQD